MKKTVRLGLIDYRLESAHAPGFLWKLEERRQKGGDLQGEIVACTAMEGAREAWARENSVPWMEDAGEMAGKVDAVVIPASSHPEFHLELFRQAVVLGVPVYLDKPFAPDPATARELFALARDHGVPLMSSSLLRFAREVTELKALAPAPDFVQTWGCDNERYDEFVIHPVEMALTLMAEPPRIVRRKRVGEVERLQLEDEAGRLADVYFTPGQQPYEAAVCHRGGWAHRVLKTDFWEPFLDRLLPALIEGTTIVEESQTLAVMEVLAAARAGGEDEPIAIPG